MLVEKLHDEAEWERFVAGAPGGTFYHSLRWKKILEDAFSFETEYLVVRDDSGALVGVCPFAITSKLRAFRILDSLPESDFGGPLVSGETSDVALRALNDYLPRLCRQRGITYAKLRCSDESLMRGFWARGMTVDTSTGSMNLDIKETPPDQLWNEVFTQKNGQRTYIRRFEKDGFENVEAKSLSDLDTFYRLYHSNMTHIGGAPHPYAFFRRLWDELYPDYFNILLTVGGGRCIGGEGFFIYPPAGTAYQSYIGLDRDVPSQYRTYFYLCWGLIRWSEGMGLKAVSFGGTPADPASPNHWSKSRFGAVFSQDYVVYLPYDRPRFMAREGALKLGRFLHRRLPRRLKSRMQKVGFGI